MSQRGSKREAPSTEVIERAEKKLRRAAFFLEYLRSLAIPACVEMQNPDGTTVRATGLVGISLVRALYIEHAGGRIAATEACARFIDLLRDLLKHFK